MFEQARISARGSLTPDTVKGLCLSPAHLIGFFMPELLAQVKGTPYHSIYELHPSFPLLAFSNKDVSLLPSFNAKETWIYLGILPFIFLFFSFNYIKKKNITFFFIIFIISLFVIFGVPGFVDLLLLLPGFKSADPKRFVYVIGFLGPILSAVGVHYFIENNKFKKLYIFLLFTIACAGILFLILGITLKDIQIEKFWLQRIAPIFKDSLEKIAPRELWWKVIADHRPSEEITFNILITRISFIRFGLIAFLTTVPLILYKFIKKGKTILIGVSIIFCVCDIIYTAKRPINTYPLSSFDIPFAWKRLTGNSVTPAKSQGIDGRLLRLEASNNRKNVPTLFVPDLGFYINIEDIQSYLPLAGKRLTEIFQTIDQDLDLKGVGVHSIKNPEDLNLPVLKLMRPGVLLSDIDFLDKNWRKVFDRTNLKIYKPKEIVPYAFVIPKWRVISNKEKRLETVCRPDFNYLETGIVEYKPELKIGFGKTTKTAQILNRKPGEIILKCEGKGLLFVSEAWHPGWNVYIDDKKEEAVVIDHAFLGAWIPEGIHTVKFVFMPKSFKMGIYLGILGFLILFSLLLIKKK